MNYILNRVLGLISLFIKKALLRKTLILQAPVFRYDISRKAQLKCGNKGIMTLERISAETNVHLVSWGGRLTIKNGCSFNRNTIVVARKEISIGSNTLVGPNVCIYDHDHSFGAEGIIKHEYKYGEINIGNNVWIGAGAIILRGTTIGNNSIIGAGCVVSGNIPNNSLVTAENRHLRRKSCFS